MQLAWVQEATTEDVVEAYIQTQGQHNSKLSRVVETASWPPISLKVLGKPWKRSLEIATISKSLYKLADKPLSNLNKQHSLPPSVDSNEYNRGGGQRSVFAEEDDEY